MPVAPLQAALDVLDRTEGLLTLDPGTEAVTLLQYDIRRQALAMGVAALDTWIHWSTNCVDLGTLAPRLGRLDVPFKALVDMGDRSIAARNAGILDKPAVRAQRP